MRRKSSESQKFCDFCSPGEALLDGLGSERLGKKPDHDLQILSMIRRPATGNLSSQGLRAKDWHLVQPLIRDAERQARRQVSIRMLKGEDKEMA